MGCIKGTPSHLALPLALDPLKLRLMHQSVPQRYLRPVLLRVPRKRRKVSATDRPSFRSVRKSLKRARRNRRLVAGRYGRSWTQYSHDTNPDEFYVSSFHARIDDLLQKVALSPYTAVISKGALLTYDHLLVLWVLQLFETLPIDWPRRRYGGAHPISLVAAIYAALWQGWPCKLTSPVGNVQGMWLLRAIFCSPL